MSARDHRSPAAPIAGAVAAMAVAGYLLPGLAAALPALRRPLGVEDRTADGLGYALTFDDGPHAQGTPAVLDLLTTAGVRATFFLVGEQIERNPALAGEIVAAGHLDRPALPPPSQPAAPDAAAGARRHRARRRRRSRTPPASRRRCTARRTACSTASALRLANARGWRTLLWSHWGRDWEARATAESIADARHRRRGRGLGAAAARRRRLLRPGLVAADGRCAAARAADARRARPAARRALSRASAARPPLALCGGVTSVACPAPFRSTQRARPAAALPLGARPRAACALALVGRAAGDRLAAVPVRRRK